MRLIKNVVVAGGSGNLGPDIIRALLSADFSVTVLSRHGFLKTTEYESPVQVIRTDYSPASLSAALTGQDAIISTLGWGAEHNAQTKLLTAAALSSNSESGTGVQRFIPTEFGMPNLDIRGHPEIVKMIQGRIQFREKMIQVVQENPKLSYTGIFTSLWFDWGLKHGLLGFDLYTKSTTIIDSGNQPFNACDMETIGLAVAGVLSHPAETANKYITITSHQTTQNEVLHALEQKTGSPWTVKREKGVEFYNASWDLMKAGINGWPAMLQSYNFRDRETPIDAPGTLDGNKLLGIGYKDVKNTVEEVLKTYPFSLLG